MCDGKYLRPVECIFLVHDRVREAIEVVNTQPIFLTGDKDLLAISGTFPILTPAEFEGRFLP